MIRLAALLLVTGCAMHHSALVPLLQPCPIAELRKYTAQEVTRVANARKASLTQCNKDKAAALELLSKDAR